MSKFELYHPILTPHYQLNWLTNFKVKDVNTLRRTMNPSETMIETANYINREMSTVMNDQALTWGIGDKQKDNFIGIVHLAPVNGSFKSAELTITRVNNDDQTLIEEIQTYLTEFSKNQLQSSQLTLKLK
ncbi:GNAT family N-acetyltransferase [Lactobacillus sp. LC28-10]|uniref:GNAT family N-acetyltransferase n=1 Tax=Secundilactobacillus angelensis TaxID=2722706 RepID=A0ABX1KYC6_9LACO|nr:GNAT family N-acetyltransferase [Secundilactobacillus angelensis]MCH5462368.1 GNAT family N-acetyltransferase [Secundilactobacillus angelensis]NLR18150.1 GNAT family N-acetyltransferase [Secundilactobacillus angelensis]